MYLLRSEVGCTGPPAIYSVENRFRAGYPNEYGMIIHQRSLEVVILSRHSPTSLLFRLI